MSANSTPTAELRRRELQRVNDTIRKAELDVRRNEEFLGWLTPWLQQDLLVRVVTPEDEQGRP